MEREVSLLRQRKCVVVRLACALEERERRAGQRLCCGVLDIDEGPVGWRVLNMIRTDSMAGNTRTLVIPWVRGIRFLISSMTPPGNPSSSLDWTETLAST